MLDLFQTESLRVISTLELLPVLMALRLWRSVRTHRRVFVFVDNDASRHALIGSKSSNRAMRLVLRGVMMELAAEPSFLWFCRVPSSSNIADLPSRFELEPLLALGAVHVSFPLHVALLD